MSVTNIMSLEKAIEIYNKYLIMMEEKPLNTKAITVSDYKKAHKDLIRAYHTDSDNPLANKTAIQEINGASESFVEQFKKTSIISLNNLKETKDEYLNKIKSFLSPSPNEETTSANKDVSITINYFSILINAAKTEEEIQAIYQNFLNEIKNIFIKLEKSFYRRYHLYDIPEQTNYTDFSLDEFYENLLRIKKFYNIDETLKREMQKYQNYPEYQILATSFNKILKKAKRSLENKVKRDIVIPQFHTEINSIITKYRNLNSRINDAKNNTRNSEYQTRLAKIEAKLNENIALEDIEAMLSHIETLIEHDKKKKEYEDLYKKIIEDNINKMRHVIQFANNSFYPSTCLNRVLTIFNLTKNGLVDLETLKLLEKITYLRPDLDEKIFQEVERRIYTSIGKSNLYVKAKNFKNEQEENAIFIMLSENEVFTSLAMWNREMSSSSQITVRNDELYSNFVPLEFYLTPDNAIWQKTEDKYLLYKFGKNDTILAYSTNPLTGNTFCILPSKMIYSQKTQIKDLEELKYPDLLTSQINKQKDACFTIKEEDLDIASPFLSIFKSRS